MDFDAHNVVVGPEHGQFSLANAADNRLSLPRLPSQRKHLSAECRRRCGAFLKRHGDLSHLGF